jgi:ADP-ribose pyrophosphatase
MYANAYSHNNLAHTFVGTNAMKIAKQSLDDSEEIEVTLIPLNEVIAMLDSPETFPTSQHATLFYALRALGRIQIS